MRTISGQVAIFLLGGAGNSNHLIKQLRSHAEQQQSHAELGHRREERLTLKERSLTADKERS